MQHSGLNKRKHKSIDQCMQSFFALYSQHLHAFVRVHYGRLLLTDRYEEGHVDFAQDFHPSQLWVTAAHQVPFVFGAIAVAIECTTGDPHISSLCVQ